VEPTIAKLSFLYDVLCEEADRIIREYNPCRMEEGGKCLTSAADGCCEGCVYLGPNGCMVQCLICKLDLCEAAKRSCPAADEQLIPLRLIARRYGMHWQIRQPKNNVMKQLKRSALKHVKKS
jgi:hypothetical protein